MVRNGLKQLPIDLCSTLRAGYCVKHFAHAVDSLVSNSIEANSMNIKVIIDLKLLEVDVFDDGCGITPHDMLHIGLRDSTSKYSTSTLLDINESYAEHKGNTLTSLSRLSKLEISSKAEGYHHSTKKIIKDGCCLYYGNDTSIESRHGTHVKLNDLFFNLPVRRKQMISSQRWRGQIRSQVVKSLHQHLLLRPYLNIILFDSCTKRRLIEFYSVSCFKKAFEQLFGTKYYLLPIIGNSPGPITLHGFISSFEYGIPSNNLQFAYMNEKSIQVPKQVQRLIMEVYVKARKEKYADSNFPVFILYFRCPRAYFNECFDDGITRISFHDWDVFQKVIRNALVKTWRLEHKVASGEASVDQRYQTDQARNNSYTTSTVQHKKLRLGSKMRHPNQKLISLDWHIHSKVRIPRMAFCDFRFVAQVERKFIIIVSQSIIICIDQHAMHERVRLESFKSELNTKQKGAHFLGIVNLKKPLAIELNEYDIELMQLRQQSLYYWGFRWEFYKEISLVSVYQVPTVFGKALTRSEEFLTFLYDDSPMSNIPKLLETAIINRSCRGAIKFGDTLTRLEAIDLVLKLGTCKNPFQCAHGRPTAVPLLRLTDHLKENKFA